MNLISLEQLQENLHNGSYRYADHDHADYNSFRREFAALVETLYTIANIHGIRTPPVNYWPDDNSPKEVRKLIDKLRYIPEYEASVVPLDYAIEQLASQLPGIIYDIASEINQRRQKMFDDMISVAGLSDYPKMGNCLLHTIMRYLAESSEYGDADEYLALDMLIDLAQTIRPHLITSKED